MRPPRPLAPLAALAAAAAVLLASPAAASAAPHLPPAGKLFHGLTGGEETSSFEALTGAHPPVFQYFTRWGGPLGYILDGAEQARARPMIHVSTFRGSREYITPGAIARGEGDAYMLELNRRFAASGQIAYIRLMAEMNGHWNLYSAFTSSGRPRGPDHTTRAFRAAWRRTVIVVRGGPVAEIDRRLAALGQPPLQGAASAALPAPPVAFLWVPQVAGAPDTRANAPRAYWPGRAYVDWVGTDFYSKYPNFRGLERFYRAFRSKPFAFGEWAVWGRDDPAFVRRFMRWVHRHRRVRMLMYNQGVRPDGPFKLQNYPRARRALSRALRSPRFAHFAPEWAGR